MYFWQSVLTLLSLKRFRNIIVASVWALAGVYLLMVLLLSLPNVQRKIGGLIANAISEKIDAPVNVGKVNVALPNRVTIDDIAIFDRSSDSMLMANRVSAKIRLREIPNKKIVISSLQAFGIDGRFYKQDGQTPANYQFVIDSLFKKEKEEKEGWKVAFNSIVVRRSKLSFDRRDKESLEDVFSPDHVRLSNVSAHIFLNNSNDGIEGVVVKRLSFDEQSGLSLKGLTARASLARDNTRLSDVHIETKQSKFNIEEMALRRVCNDVGDTLQGFSTIVRPSQLGLDDVKRIVPKLKNLDGIVDFEGKIEGNNDGYRIEDVRIEDKARATLIVVDGAYSKKGDVWTANVNNVASNGRTISDYYAMFTGDEKLRRNFEALGDIRASVNVVSRNDIVESNGKIFSDQGALDFNVDYMKSTNGIKAKLNATDLNIGALASVDGLGETTAEVSIESRNISERGGTIVADGKIKKLVYGGNSFSNITANCALENEKISGFIAADDIAGDLRLSGTYHLKDKRAENSLSVLARNFSPYVLGLDKEHPTRRFDFDMESSFFGNNIAEIEGDVTLKHIVISDDVHTDYINRLELSSALNGKEREISMDGDFGEATINGRFDINTLGQSFVNIVADKLPSVPGIRVDHTINNRFSFSGTLRNLELACRLLELPASIDDDIKISGFIDNFEHKTNLSLDCRNFRIGDNQFEDGHVDLNTPSDSLFADVSLRQRDEKGKPLDVVLTAKAADNRLGVSMSYDASRKNGIRGLLNADAQFFINDEESAVAHIIIHPSNFEFDGNTWEIQPSDIIYSKDRLIVDHLSLERGNQHFTVYGNATKNENDTLMVDMNGVDVSDVLDLINFHSIEFDGDAIGKIQITSAFQNPRAFADLTVKNFSMEGGRLGTLYAKASLSNDNKQIDIDATALDEDGSTVVGGYISLEDNYIDLDVDAQNTRLEFIEGFCGSFMNDVEMFGLGQVRVFGDLKTVNLEGEVFANGSLGLKNLGTHYNVPGDTILLRPDTIEFRNCYVTDDFGGHGTLNGGVYHRSLKDITYNIPIHVEKMLAMDTKPEEGTSFYGKVFATGDCTVRGRSGETVIDIEAHPELGSILYYNVSSPEEIASQSFINWNDKNKTADETDENDESKKKEEDEAISDLKLNIVGHANTNMLLHLIMDQQTGDYIELSGTGTLRATYYNKGAFEIFGNYTVQDGIYRLTIQNVIHKEFEFQPNGTIAFGGNPYNAPLDLRALYVVNGVSLADLNIGRSFTSQNIRADCYMNITGTPMAPQVDFSLDLPTVGSDAKQMVNSILNSQEETNQQVLYLLAVGRFYNQQNARQSYSENSPQTQASLAMQSILSGTLSQQLTEMLRNVTGNSNWNIGANISTGDEGFNNAEYEGLLSGKLLNNRLIINGQFGYRDNPNATSSFIGDFDIKYLLRPNGNLAVRVYNQTSDRYFTPSSLTTQGIGLIMKHDFGSLHDIFHKRKTINATIKEDEDKAKKTLKTKKTKKKKVK